MMSLEAALFGSEEYRIKNVKNFVSVVSEGIEPTRSLFEA